MSADAGVARLERRRADLALLGHELRNPLAAALTGVATASLLTAADDPRAPLLARANRDLQRLGHLLAAYLDLLGGRVACNEVVDLAALLRAVANRRGNGTVGVVPSIGDCAVRGHAALLERALENLVDNALHCGARRVELAVRREGATCCIDVRDDGPGVPAALRDNLFAAFVSGRGSTGLGLVLVRDIALAHAGDVRLLPSAAGAHFEFSVPARVSAPAAGEAAEATCAR